MVPQQVQSILRYLKEVYGIEKHLVTEALLPKGTPPFPGREYMSMKDIQKYLRENAETHGNLWWHCQGCAGTYTPYRVNTWVLRNTETNKEDGREKVPQQVNNILHHLHTTHGMSVDCIY